MTLFSCSVVTLALSCTISELKPGIAANSQLQPRTMRAESPHDLSKNCEAVIFMA